jgi:hypothetical protein
MFKKALFLALFVIAATIGAKAQVSPDPNPLPANLQLPFTMKLPNNNWYLAVNGAPDHYVFKRRPIKDSNGHDIIPAIMIYVESKDEVKEDMGQVYKDNPVKDLRDLFEAFWDVKMMPLVKNGVQIKTVLKATDAGFPLTYRTDGGSVFITAEYSSAGFDHIIYLTYIIDNHNRGIQVYMDMTKDIDKTYDKEFMDFIRSLKEI